MPFQKNNEFYKSIDKKHFEILDWPNAINIKNNVKYSFIIIFDKNNIFVVLQQNASAQIYKKEGENFNKIFNLESKPYSIIMKTFTTDENGSIYIAISWMNSANVYKKRNWSK